MFKMKNLREIKKFFNIKIIRDRKRHTIYMNQFYWLTEIFDKLYTTADKHTRITFFINEYNLFCSIKSDDERINSRNYPHKINKLMYIAIHIRSNIVFAIEHLNQYFNDLTTHHQQTLRILFRYIRLTIDFNIVFKMKSNSSESLKLLTFSNSDYIIDKLNKKSILEYVYIFVERSIAWISRK